MTRNLRKRIEIACPVYDKQIREQLLWILDKQWEDDSENGGFSAQEEFMKRSIHEIGKTAEPEDTAAQEAAPEKEEEPEKKKGFFARLFGRK